MTFDHLDLDLIMGDPQQGHMEDVRARKMEDIVEEGSEGEDVASTYYFNDFQDMKEHMSSPQTRSREDKKQRQVGFSFCFNFLVSVSISVLVSVSVSLHVCLIICIWIN